MSKHCLGPPGIHILVTVPIATVWPPSGGAVSKRSYVLMKPCKVNGSIVKQLFTDFTTSPPIFTLIQTKKTRLLNDGPCTI